MMNVTRNIAVAGFAIALASPGFAQNEAPTDTTPMSCSEFMTLNSTDMGIAIGAVRVKAGSAEYGGGAGEEIVDPTAKTDGGVGSEPATGDGADNLGEATVPEVQAPAATTDGVNSGLSTNAKNDAAMDETVAELSTGELVALTMTACTGNPDMMIADVETGNK